MRIAYLASPVTLPGSPTRRSDAFEHDQMMDALSVDKRLNYEAVSWDDPTADWSGYDAVVIGTVWDYWDRMEAFLPTLDEIAAQTALYNPPSLVRWNSHKSYLKDLETRGAKLIPTVWLETVTPKTAKAAFEKLGSDDLVFKRQVGAGAEGQHRLQPDTPLPDLPHPMMVQPFLGSIQSEGEYSFIFIDGVLSHALVKRAKPGDYRIQSAYGGTEERIEPSSDDLSAACAIIETLEEPPLYARVDMVRGAEDQLLLMELELIEPFLYPLQGPALGNRIGDALLRRLSKG